MQLNKKLIPIVVATAISSPMVLNASSSDEVSFKQMKYSENDDRIDIDYSVLDFKKDIGTDYSVAMSFSYDSISGGTPIWTSGASQETKSDEITGASECIRGGKYICKDTREGELGKILLGNGYTNKDKLKYENVQIEDTRKAANITLTKRTASRDEMTFGAAYSKEEDFKSLEGSLSYLYNIDNSRNSSISAGISYQANSSHNYLDNKWEDFHIVNTQIGYTHTFSKYTVGQINYFYIRQSGVLTNPYQTIVRKIDISTDVDRKFYKHYIAREKRPDEKNSAGMTFDLVSKVHKNVSLHGDYRLYKDDWGVLSHTFSTSAFIDIGKGFTLIPLFRYYTQKAASFYKDHKANDFTFNIDDYGSADERLSKFHGTTYSLGLEKKFTNNLSANIHYAKQEQSFGLEMNWVSVGLSYSF